MKYKFVANLEALGIVEKYNPAYRQTREAGIRYMTSKVKETQRYANYSFNKPVKVMIYEKRETGYEPVDSFQVDPLAE